MSASIKKRKIAKNKPKSENDSVFPTSFIFVNSNKKMLNLSQKNLLCNFGPTLC